MFRKTCLIAVLAVAPLATAQAQNGCLQPAAPPGVDGGSATADQMRAVMAAARDFIAQSDVYQLCVARDLDAAKTQAAANKQPFDPALEVAARTKVVANQRMKEKVGADANAAVWAYKESHPN